MTARAGDAALRARVRAARRGVPLEQRHAADVAIRRHVRHMPEFRSAKRVALFLAFDGEPDLTELIRFDQPREFFAPIISRTEMAFAQIGAQMTLAPNYFGIPEPHPARLVDARSLDLVLTPLVAFDGSGNRIGVGAGYYDRCFSFLRHRRNWLKPKLVGVAYSLQEVATTNPKPWDIPLNGIVTEHGYRRFRRP